MARKPSTKAGKAAKTKKVLEEFKAGTLHAGSKTGPVVKSKDQALAIALRSAGVPKKKVKKGKR